MDGPIVDKKCERHCLSQKDDWPWGTLASLRVLSDRMLYSQNVAPLQKGLSYLLDLSCVNVPGARLHKMAEDVESRGRQAKVRILGEIKQQNAP